MPLSHRSVSRRFLPLVVAWCVCVGLSATTWAQTARPTPAPAPVAVGSVMDVMQALTIPSSDALFKAPGEPPTTPEAWTSLRTQIVLLAESGNLLMMGTRVKDRATWLSSARAMVDAASAALRAVERKDATALSDASDKVYDTCEACHARYLKK